MTKETIENLPGILRNHICAMRRVSRDDSRASYMCESSIKVIDFDKIPKDYSRIMKLPVMPASNDALYISADSKWHFIEFKNGTVDKLNIHRKIYDSIIMLIELGIIPNFHFARENINYILVYNSNNYSKVPESESREANFSYILKLAQEESRLFGVEKLEKYLVRETHTYTKELFEKNFVIPMEQQENHFE